MRHHVGRFFGRVRGFVHELILSGAMAMDGPAPLDAHDLQQAEQQAQVQAAYLDRFRAEVELHAPVEIAVPGAPPEPGAMTALQFAARTEQYAGVAWGHAINARREKVKRSGRYTMERRVHAKPLGQHDACETCLGESARGWQPIGTLLPIGDSECLGIRCDCFYEYGGERAA
jgi:hypothetical protein